MGAGAAHQAVGQGQPQWKSAGRRLLEQKEGGRESAPTDDCDDDYGKYRVPGSTGAIVISTRSTTP